MILGRHKIGTRMGFGLGLILVLMIFLVLLGILSMKDINENMEAVIKRNNRQIWFANVIKDAVHTIDEAMLTVIQTTSEERKNFEYVKILTEQATYRNAVEELERLEGSEEGKALIMRLKNALTTAMSHVTRAMDLTRTGRYATAKTAYLMDARVSVSSLHQICSELAAFEERLSITRYTEAVHTYQAARRFFIIIAVAMVLFAVSAAIILTKSITRRINKGVHIANRLAEGDLDVPIEADTDDETGQLLKAMGNMVHRLKQTKELEHQLLQSQKLETVGRLAGGIAHDFNNMLNVILGSAELIKIQRGVSKKIYERCEAIEKAVTRAAGFARQLLVFSRRQMLELKIMDLTHLVADFEKMIRRMIGEHIEMRVDAHQDSAMVKVDVSQINQVLLNLVVNSREAMPEGGRLVIGLSHTTVDHEESVLYPDASPGEYVVLSVSDTGVGMSEEVVNNIFEPFFTTKESGTGLGLSVVYGIVRQHGGFVTVRTEVGEGTEFRVHLPSAATVSSGQAVEEREVAIVSGEGTILVVEDDDEVRRTATDLLTLLGYNVLVASDGLQGVEVFREHHRAIDLVLLDMVMPKLNGYEAYQEMRRIDQDLASLFVTGYNSSDAGAASLNGDGIEVIQKPYSAVALSMKIREIMTRKSSLAA